MFMVMINNYKYIKETMHVFKLRNVLNLNVYGYKILRVMVLIYWLSIIDSTTTTRRQFVGYMINYDGLIYNNCYHLIYIYYYISHRTGSKTKHLIY